MAKTLIGTVVSNRMEKTIVVQIERTMRHPRYGKVIRRTRRIKAHFEGKKPEMGTAVTIRETRPISKETAFVVVEPKQ